MRVEKPPRPIGPVTYREGTGNVGGGNSFGFQRAQSGNVVTAANDDSRIRPVTRVTRNSRRIIERERERVRASE